jgi:hypothetical protein
MPEIYRRFAMTAAGGQKPPGPAGTPFWSPGKMGDGSSGKNICHGDNGRAQ